MFTPSFLPRGKHYILFGRMEGRTENFIPRGKFTPKGQFSSLGGQLRPWGQSLPLGAKWGMSLCTKIMNFAAVWNCVSWYRTMPNNAKSMFCVLCRPLGLLNEKLFFCCTYNWQNFCTTFLPCDRKSFFMSTSLLMFDSTTPTSHKTYICNLY
jgi:hypothetical protein